MLERAGNQEYSMLQMSTPFFSSPAPQVLPMSSETQRQVQWDSWRLAERQVPVPGSGCGQLGPNQYTNW